MLKIVACDNRKARSDFVELQCSRPLAAVIDALTGALPEPLTAWVRHLVDQERDSRAGTVYRCGRQVTSSRAMTSRLHRGGKTPARRFDRPAVGGST